MANVNLETKEIFGCVKGTKTYYHEVGHLVFEKEYLRGNFIRAVQDLSIKGLLFGCALAIIYPHPYLKVPIIVFILASCISQIIEESWCWKYANQQLKLADKKEDDNSEPTGTEVSSV